MSRLFLCSALFAVACPPPIPEDTDVGTDTDTDTDTDSDTEPFTITLGENDEFLPIASQVSIDNVVNTRDPFVVVIRTDVDGTTFGEVRGSAGFEAGRYSNVPFDIEPPASGSETLWMVMYEDSNDNGLYDEGIDIATLVDGEPVQETFQAIVRPGTPEVRIRFEEASPGFVVTEFIPSQLRDATLGPATTDETINPQLRLQRARRYEFVNTTDRPLQFVESGATPEDDTIRLAEGPVEGVNEDDEVIDWVDEGNGLVLFTPNVAFLANVDAYRDGDDTAVRGDITPQAVR